MIGSSFPRLLIVTPNSISKIAGSSILIRNIIERWPEEKLAQLYAFSSDNQKLETKIREFPLSDSAEGNILSTPKQLLKFVAGTAVSADHIATSRLTRDLKLFVSDFEPQVIYSQLGSLWLMRLTRQLAAFTGKPLVTHVMDDYIVDWPYNGHQRRRRNPAFDLLNNAAKREFRRLQDMASLRLVICEDMAREYSVRYQKEFDFISNGVDLSAWQTGKVRQSKQDSNAFKICFTGSILPNTNLHALKQLASEIEVLRRTGDDVSLHIYSENYSQTQCKSLKTAPGIFFHEPARNSELPQVLSEHDLLLLPFNQDEESIIFFRLSWPTKLAEYMAVGRPILYFGPDDTSFARYLARERLAFLLPDLNSSSLRELMIRISKNEAEVDAMSERSARAVRRDFDVNQIRQKFENHVLSILQ